MKQAPQSVQLERAITHLLLADWDKLLLYGNLLDEKMFLEPVNHQFIKTACRLHLEGTLTKLNLLDAMQAQGVKDPSYVYTLQVAAVTSSSDFLKHYSAWIEHARMHYVAVCDAELLDKDLSSTEFIAQRMLALERARALGFPDQGVSMEQAIDSGVEWQTYLRNVDKNKVISTGFDEIDRNIIGLIPGTLTTLAARPGVGKTTMAVKWGSTACKAGPVMFNTLEMAPARIAFKIAALANGDNPMAYDRSFMVPESEFNAICTVLKRQHGLDFRFFEKHDAWALESSVIMLNPSLLVWDFLQITSTPAKYAGRRNEFIGEVARFLQQLAKRRHIPVLLLSQLNRDGDGGGATLANLKDSSGIEEASDNVFFLENPNENAVGGESLRRLLGIKKARSGLAGTTVELMMNPVTGAFEYWNTILAAQLMDAARST